MGQILIRDLNDSVIDALEQLAVDHGSSTEDEARRALTSSVALGRREFIHRLDAVRAVLGPQSGPSILDDLRAGRARDD